MSKNLINSVRDVLHLYIGCDYQWQDESGEWRRAQRLTSYQYNDVIKHHINSRLILRPLSSMTEDERKELNWDGLELDHAISQTREKALYTSEWIWLLKNGFDLFGLIEAGFAIDSTERVGVN